MSNLENKLLNILSDRAEYEKYREYVPEQMLSPVSRRVLGYVDKYWNDYETEAEFDWESFTSWVEHIASRDPHIEAIQQVCNVCAECDEKTTSVARDILNKAVEKDVAEQIQSQIDAGELDLVTIRELISDLESFKSSDLEEGEKNVVSTDIEEVLKNSHITEPGLPFSLECLRMSIGPLRAGDTVFVPARPEVGKTTFLVQQVGYMVQEVEGANAIIFSNEEDGNRVMIRLYQSVLGWTTKDILKDPAKARSEYERKLGDRNRIKVVHSSSLSRKDVEKNIARNTPNVVAFNLLSKIKGFQKYSRDQNEVDLYSSQALWMRELANNYNCACMTAWQAGGSAHGKAWVEQDDMYMSKTGVVGEADVIIGIGQRIEPGVPENHRYIHLSKNKLPGDKYTDERFRHGYFDEVYIDTERGRFFE